ncbi:MAG: hypothetical protein IIX61_03535, partial [Loktanella sp.]|nr:hypothetical protein [Loktanella sp.]
PLALRIARGWFGLPGRLGWVRAFVGGFVALIVAAVIGGSLILPGYGTLYAPLMVLTAVMARPVVGLIWFAGAIGSHWAIIQADAARAAQQQLEREQEMSSLSALSQTYFYRK